jgi:lambda family phage portal protein
MNIIDRAIAYIAPVAGARRAEARAVIAGMENATALYDGAARSWRTSGRHIGATSANVEVLRSAEQLRNVSRDLRRNNATADNAIRVISTHVVGAGILPTVETSSARLKKKLQALIKSHLETTAIDFDGRHNLYGLQRLVMDTVVEAGEALIIKRVANLPVPLQVQVLEPEYLDKRMTGPAANGNTLFEGIEVDPQGRRVAYYIYSSHPGGGLTWQLPNSTRVDAADVIHVYRQDRPGQMRGIPWCAPIIVTMNDLADYEDADLVRQKIAACFSVFLKGTSSDTNLAQQNAGQATRQGTIIDKVEPGLIQKLPPGVEAQFGTPPTVQGQKDFISIKNHKIAAGYGVPYELLTTDLREVSFISGRLGLMQFHRTVDQWRWHMLIPHLCDGIGRWFLQAAMISLQTDMKSVTLRHTPPRREMIEPSKEVNAMRDAIRNGLTSRDEEVRSLGLDPTEIDEEIKAGNERADKLGIAFDSDGRRPLAFKLDTNTPESNADGKKPVTQ